MLRTLALRLACLHPRNRRSILGKLNSSERTALQPLLDDIARLGLASDPAAVISALADGELNNLAPSASSEPLAHVQGLSPFWQRLLLQDSDPETNAVEAMAPSDTLPPKLRSALQELVRETQ